MAAIALQRVALGDTACRCSALGGGPWSPELYAVLSLPPRHRRAETRQDAPQLTRGNSMPPNTPSRSAGAPALPDAPPHTLGWHPSFPLLCSFCPLLPLAAASPNPFLPPTSPAQQNPSFLSSWGSQGPFRTHSFTRTGEVTGWGLHRTSEPSPGHRHLPRHGTQRTSTQVSPARVTDTFPGMEPSAHLRRRACDCHRLTVSDKN